MNNRNQEPKKNLGRDTAVAVESSLLCPVPKANSLLQSRQPSRQTGAGYAVHLRNYFQRARSFFAKLIKRRSHQRKLQLLEIQQLGEKRFVAIVRVGKQKFLIGGAASSVSLLAEIGAQRATVLPSRPLSEESA